MPAAHRHRRRFGTMAWMALCLAATGCATTAPYQAGGSPPANIAIVQGMHEFHWNYWYKLGTARVDGKSVHLTALSDWAKPVAVDPGARVITAKCLFSLHGSRTEEVTVDLSVFLQAGHSYRLRNGVEGSSVTFWVEDMQTHLPAGKEVAVSTTPSSAGATAAGAAAGVLLRILLLFGTGH